MRSTLRLASIATLLFAGFAFASDPNLVGWWKFDEGAGTVAYDSASSHNGTIYGADWDTGRIDGALSFNGNSDYVELGNTVKSQLGTAYTVCAWIKTNTLVSNHQVISYRDSISTNNPPPFLFQLDQLDTDVRFMVADNSRHQVTATFSNVLTTDTWFHVAGVRIGNQLNVYVNGISGTPGSGTLGSISSDNLKIGALLCHGAPVDKFFDGIIDDVRVYNRALSAAEIQQLAIPEPATVMLLGIGGLLLRRSKR